jgi:hypothetical protein
VRREPPGISQRILCCGRTARAVPLPKQAALGAPLREKRGYPIRWLLKLPEKVTLTQLFDFKPSIQQTHGETTSGIG